MGCNPVLVVSGFIRYIAIACPKFEATFRTIGKPATADKVTVKVVGKLKLSL